MTDLPDDIHGEFNGKSLRARGFGEMADEGPDDPAYVEYMRCSCVYDAQNLFGLKKALEIYEIRKEVYDAYLEQRKKDGLNDPPRFP